MQKRFVPTIFFAKHINSHKSESCCSFVTTVLVLMQICNYCSATFKRPQTWVNFTSAHTYCCIILSYFDYGLIFSLITRYYDTGKGKMAYGINLSYCKWCCISIVLISVLSQVSMINSILLWIFIFVYTFAASFTRTLHYRESFCIESERMCKHTDEIFSSTFNRR